MYKYLFERHFISETKGYDINNPYDVDGEGNEVALKERIKVSISGLDKIICKASICNIYFDHELTPEEQESLRTIVSVHQSKR